MPSVMEQYLTDTAGLSTVLLVPLNDGIKTDTSAATASVGFDLAYVGAADDIVSPVIGGGTGATFEAAECATAASVTGLTIGGSSSISAFVKFDSLGSNQGVLHATLNSTNYIDLQYIAGLDKLRARARSTALGADSFDAVAASVVVGQWYYVTVTRDSSGNLSILLDGVELSGSSGTITTSASGPATAFGHSTNGTAFLGSVAMASYHNAELSAAQVLAILENNRAATDLLWFQQPTSLTGPLTPNLEVNLDRLLTA